MLDGIVWPFQYQTPIIKTALKNLKYKGRRNIILPFTDFLRESASVFMLPSDALVIPIPLYPIRERERGFNQSSMLAHAAFPIPTNSNVLIRIRSTPPQARSQSRKERFEHMRDAFFVRTPEMISGKVILLIDDVVTTGATLSTAAITLKKAGAAKVFAATIAH
ncbi:MAG: phosphoribosyltransferase family protein [Patescibacteria group bacterium]